MVMRPSAPFTVFYRSHLCAGGFSCDACGMRSHGVYSRASDAVAAATQHLNLCRRVLRHRPVEGTVIIDGSPLGAVLRDGFMIVSVPTVFAAAPQPVRIVA